MKVSAIIVSERGCISDDERREKNDNESNKAE